MIEEFLFDDKEKDDFPKFPVSEPSPLTREEPIDPPPSKPKGEQ